MNEPTINEPAPAADQPQPGVATITIQSLIPPGAAADFNARVDGAIALFQQSLCAGATLDLALSVFQGGCQYATNLLAAAILGNLNGMRNMVAGARIVLAKPAAAQPQPAVPTEAQDPPKDN